jgi:hypothetical protein
LWALRVGAASDFKIGQTQPSDAATEVRWTLLVRAAANLKIRYTNLSGATNEARRTAVIVDDT